MENFIPVKNKLRVVFTPVLGEEDYVEEVASEKEAKSKLITLGLFNIYLQDTLKILADQPNIGYVEMLESIGGYESEDWVPYWNEELGMEWDEVEDLIK